MQHIRKNKFKKAFFALICFNFLLFLNNSTGAYFLEEETITSNAYEAGTLQFNAYSDEENFIPLHKADNMQVGSAVRRSIYITQQGNLPFQYSISAKPIENTCDSNLFNNLNLNVFYNYVPPFDEDANYHGNEREKLKYDGLLNGFQNINFGKFLGADNNELLHFILELLPSYSSENKEYCEFDFEFIAWQDGLPAPYGFTSTKTIRSHISTKDNGNADNEDKGKKE